MIIKNGKKVTAIFKHPHVITAAYKGDRCVWKIGSESPDIGGIDCTPKLINFPYTGGVETIYVTAEGGWKVS